MRPIDADELIVEFLKYPMMLRHSGDFVAINLDSVIFEVRKAPTLDYKDLVPQGEWIYHECVSSYDGTISGYSCSNCCSFVDEDVFDTDEFHKAFCGNCGARMKGND
jgi:hypothetical protein